MNALNSLLLNYLFRHERRINNETMKMVMKIFVRYRLHGRFL